MNESNEGEHIEGNAEIEATEQKVFGSNYEKVEIAHKYAVDNTWVHPVTGITLLILVALLIFFLKKKRK